MKFPVFTLLCAFSVSACAQTTPAAADATTPPPAAKVAAPAPAVGTPAVGKAADGSKEAMVRAALKALNPKIGADHIGPAPIPGFSLMIQ